MNIRWKIIDDAYRCIEKNQAKLTDWEKEFMINLRGQINAGKELSQKQFNTLQDIYQKYKTS